jgi:hypothetical protein
VKDARLIIAVALVTLTVTGCSATRPAPPVTVTVTATAIAVTPSAHTATPRVSSTTVTATPSQTAPVITTAGFGDLRLGHPVPSDSSVVTWDATACGEAPAGLWRSADNGGALTVMTDDGTRAGRISGILVQDSAIHTKSGAHVGMSEVALRALFPQAVRKTSEAGTRIYVVSDGLGTVGFETEQPGGPLHSDEIASIQVLPFGQVVTTIARIGYFSCGE